MNRLYALSTSRVSSAIRSGSILTVMILLSVALKPDFARSSARAASSRTLLKDLEVDVDVEIISHQRFIHLDIDKITYSLYLVRFSRSEGAV